MKLEEKVLPALLRCRLPRASEKQKMEEALTILKERYPNKGMHRYSFNLTQV
jgi:hypothetical protein